MDAAKPLRLIIDGYTDYFTATSMYAADQAGIKVIAPYIEALDAQGKWGARRGRHGFPAGLERTMVADLTGNCPQARDASVSVNNLKIYWDAIRIDQTTAQSDARVAEVPLAHAALDFLGYPREIRLTPASDTTYSYTHRTPADRTPAPPVTTPAMAMWLSLLKKEKATTVSSSSVPARV